MLTITYFAFFFVIFISVLYFIREIVLWYWKIDKQINLLEEIRDLLKAKPLK